MTWAMISDAIQATQGILVILAFLFALGAWRQRAETTPAVLAHQLAGCRAQCDREVAMIRAEMTAFARRDTIGETLRGMDVRLANIERALRVGMPED